MICKQAYAIPGVWQITSSVTTKQVAGSCEISSFKLISTGGSAHVKLYDSVGSADSSSLKWALDSSLYTNDSHDFSNPLVFEKGVYAVCEDGFSFSPILCLSKVTPR